MRVSVCTCIKSSSGRFSQTPALPMDFLAAPSAGARPGVLRSRTGGWLRLCNPPPGFLSRRWGLPSPQHRFPLRSACLADGSIPRATRHLAGGGCRPHTLAFLCTRLVLQETRYRGQQSALQVGVAAPHPAFRCARLVSQTARYRGQRST
jgi:hypothetical protein